MENNLHRSALALALLAASASCALAQRDTWDDKISQYVDREKYLMTVIKKTADATVVYLCKPNGNAWWAFKINDPTFKRATIKLSGASSYNTYDAGGQAHGQGVFFGHERGPLPERAFVLNERFAPLSTARLSISAATERGERRELDLGALSPKAITEIADKCRAQSFPRVLHARR